MKLLKRIPLHPFFMGLFPIISLYAHNLDQLEIGSAIRSLIIVLIGTIFVLGIIRLILRDWNQAGYITTFGSFLFFLYGSIKESLKNYYILGLDLAHNRFLLPIWLLVLVLGIWVIVKKFKKDENIVFLFNIFTLTTLILPIFSIISFAALHPESFIPFGTLPASLVVKGQPGTIKEDKRPDIYYIVLDMYGRSDTVEKEFGYDNSSFLQDLRDQGFYIASCSTSNYGHTQLSMASALNMDYLPNLGSSFVAGNTDYSETSTLIKENAVRKYLKSYGYSYITFENEFPFLNTPDSDVYIKIPRQKKESAIRPFELMLLEKTVAGIFIDQINTAAAKFGLDGTIRKYGFQYDRTLFVLDQLTKLSTKNQGPKFVYAHLLIPHPPYVFGPKGEYIGNDEQFTGGPNKSPVNTEAYYLGYTNQMKYINSRLPGILKQIQAQSKIPPIIVIQGDHGFWGEFNQRLPILNAYLLPGKNPNTGLQDDISPVNTFRIILNTYFNGHFQILENKSYLSQHNDDFYNWDPYVNPENDCRKK